MYFGGRSSYWWKKSPKQKKSRDTVSIIGQRSDVILSNHPTLLDRLSDRWSREEQMEGCNLVPFWPYCLLLCRLSCPSWLLCPDLSVLPWPGCSVLTWLLCPDLAALSWLYSHVCPVLAVDKYRYGFLTAWPQVCPDWGKFKWQIYVSEILAGSQELIFKREQSTLFSVMRQLHVHNVEYIRISYFWDPRPNNGRQISDARRIIAQDGKPQSSYTL
jgi:hypothetical protein